MKLFPTPSRFCLLLCLALYACDNVRPDDAPQPQFTAPTVVSTSPGNGAAINLLSVDKYKNADGFAIAKQPLHGNVRFVKEAILLYTPTTIQPVASDYFLLKVTRKAAAQPSLDTIRITFTLPDSASCQPGAQPDQFTVSADSSLTLNVLVNDSFCSAALNTASFLVVSGPENGTVTGSSGYSLRYSPRAGFAGADRLVYQICSQQGDCSLGVATITVNACTPVLRNDPISYTATSPLDSVYTFGIPLDAFQPGSCTIDPAKLTISSAPRHGTARWEGLQIIYKANTGFKGADQVGFSYCQGTPPNCQALQGSMQIEIR